MNTRRNIDQRITPFIVAGFLLVAWVLLSLTTYFMLTIQREQRFDFFPRWEGSRAVLDHENPYKDEVTWRIQEKMFGSILAPEEDQQRFAYPAIITWLLLPFWLLPFPIAISLWSGLLFLLLLLLPLAVAAHLNWQVSPFRLIVMLLFSIFVYRYPVNAYLIGQFIPFLLACLVVAWWGLANEHWEITTAALILGMVRPEVILLPLLALLFLSWQRRNRRIVITWVVSIAILWLITRVWIGPWVGDFVEGLFAYQAYSAPVWPPMIPNNTLLAITLVVGILGWSLWMWKEVDALDDTERIGWILSITILAGLVIFPQTGNYTLIMGLLPVWIMFWVNKKLVQRWIPVLIVLSFPWVFLAGGKGFYKWEHLIVPLSLAMLLSLHWRIRKRSFEEDSLTQILLGNSRTSS